VLDSLVDEHLKGSRLLTFAYTHSSTHSELLAGRSGVYYRCSSGYVCLRAYDRVLLRTCLPSATCHLYMLSQCTGILEMGDYFHALISVETYKEQVKGELIAGSAACTIMGTVKRVFTCDPTMSSLLSELGPAACRSAELEAASRQQRRWATGKSADDVVSLEPLVRWCLLAGTGVLAPLFAVGRDPGFTNMDSTLARRLHFATFYDGTA